MSLLGSNNIVELLMTVFPVTLYAWLAIKFSKNGMLDKRTAFMHLMLGVLSFAWVDLFHFVFPMWHMMMDIGILWSMLIFTVIQTGVLEESMKFGCYLVGKDMRKKSSPMESVLYMMLVGCGFAIVENILYIKMFGNMVIIPRAFSALVHMSCGVIIGYFFNVGRTMELSRIKKAFLPVTGIILASVYHGIFNLNLITRSDFTIQRMILILILGVSGACFLIEDMKNRIKSFPRP